MLNELIAEVHENGARLVVEGGRLGIDGDVPEETEARVRERREELKGHLAWDRGTARGLMRRAWRYVAARHAEGSGYAPGIVEGPEEEINGAFAREDMWAFRVAVRRWVEAWMAAITEAKEEEAA